MISVPVEDMGECECCTCYAGPCGVTDIPDTLNIEIQSDFGPFACPDLDDIMFEAEKSPDNPCVWIGTFFANSCNTLRMVLVFNASTCRFDCSIHTADPAGDGSGDCAFFSSDVIPPGSFSTVNFFLIDWNPGEYDCGCCGGLVNMHGTIAA